MYNRPHRANPSRDENLTENGERTPQHSGRFDGAHAAAWHKWFHIMEDAAQPVSDLMVERAGLAPGHRVLDVATGLGEPAIAAARRIAPTGFVEATDISEDMLGFGRARAAELGVTNIAFRRMGAEEAGQSAAAYDAVLCRWGLMFVDGLDSVLAGLRECPVPGGCLAATVWGPPEGAPALGLAARVVLESLGMAPPDEGAKTPFALADVAALERRFENAGLAQIRGEWMTVTFHLREPRTICRLPQGPLPPPHGQYRQPTGGAPGGGVGGRGGGGGALHRP